MKIICATLIVLFGLLYDTAFSKPLPVSPLKFENARIFTPLKGSNATAGYAVIINDSDLVITLALVSVELFGAVETHETTERDGRMAMHKIEVLTIPAHGTFELKPGGHHMMLFDPNPGLKDGDTVKAKFKWNGTELTELFKLVPRVGPPKK